MFWDILYSTLTLVAGMGVFLVGIALFSSALASSSSTQMRLTLKKLSGNRFKGFGLGIGATAVVQSSTITTIMVVGLVNSGILTLFQATAIIMGANVGSTFTSVLVALSTVSFSAFKIKYFFMALAFSGALVKLITKKEGLIKIADVMVSFGVLFVGLELMSDAFSGDSVLSHAFSDLFQAKAVQFPLLAILIGILFTVIMQSSAGTLAVLIALSANNLLGFEVALYLILGAKIGTTLTTFLASIGANTNAQRTAMVHFLFNLIGTIFFTIIIWPTQKHFVAFYQSIIKDEVWQVTMFHVFSSAITGLMLIGFINPLNRFVVWIIKEHPQDEDILRPQFINDGLFSTPAIALGHTFMEMKDLAEKTRKNINRAFEMLIYYDFSKKEKIRAEKAKIDFLYQKITEYLIKFSNFELPDFGQGLIGKLYHFAHDIKRMSGHAIFMLNNTFKMKENGLKFAPNTVDELKYMCQQLNDLFLLSYEVLDEKEDALSKLRQAIDLGKSLSKKGNSFADAYLGKLMDNEFSVELGEFVYSAYISFGSIAGYISSIMTSLIPKGNLSDEQLNSIIIQRMQQMQLIPTQLDIEPEIIKEVAAVDTHTII